jgi:hypothetical protein
MSAYQAKISLIVEGEQKIKSLQDRVNNLSKQITELTRLDVRKVFDDTLISGAISHLKKAREEEAKATNGVIKGQRLLNNSTEQRLVQQIKLNAAADLYARRVNELGRTSAGDQKQFQARIEDIQKGFEFFKGKGNVQGVQAVATELGRIVEYSREVNRLETGRIRSQEQLRGYSAEIAKYKALGLNTNKAETTFDKLAVNAGTNKYALAEKYNIVLGKRLRILKDEATAQKQEANRVEKLQFRPSSPIQGAVDIIGSPINKQMGTQAAVALAQQKQKATDLELKELQNGTKSAVALAQQKQKATDLELKELQNGTKSAVALAQQKQKATDLELKELQNGTKSAVSLAQQKQKAADLELKELQNGTKSAVSLAQQKQKAADLELKELQNGTKSAVSLAQQKQKAADLELKELQNGTKSAVSLAQQKQKAADLELKELQNGTKSAVSLAQQKQKAADLELKELQKGTKSAVALAQQKQKAADLELKKLQKGTKSAVALAQQKQKAADQQKKAGAQRAESIALGVGFPLMFGAGPASLAGSLAGSFVGSGFGGQILGGALGQMIDDAVVSVRDLGNALSLVGDNYSTLRETGIQFTAELESQVRAAKQLGEYTKANKLQQSALIVTGDISAFTGSQTSATEGVAASVNRLNAVWNEVTKTVSLLLGLVGAPFIEAVSLILKGVNAVLVVVNALATGVGGLLARLPRVAGLIKKSNEEALKTTAEYQNQIAEQDKLIEQAIRLNKANAELNTLALKNVRLLGAEKQAADLTLRSKEKQAALEEEIRKIKEAASTGTEEQKAKAAQLEAQARIKANGEVFKDQIALYGSLYDRITADNINIARQKQDQEKNYRDMVRGTALLQADLNLDIARKAQDLRVQNIEKENKLIKRQADLRISGLELESKKRLSGMAEFVPGIDTEEQQIKIGVTEAVDTLKIGLAKIDAEAADRQRKLKTNLIRLDIENERYKYDMAVRISRLNVDNINKVAVINTQINRQNQDASRQKYKEGLELLREQVDAAAIANKANLPEAKENVRLAKEQGINTAYYVESLNTLQTRAVELQNLITKLDALLKKTPEALPLVKQLPTVSGDTSAVKQQSDRLRQLTVDSDRVSGQETQAQIAGLTQAQNTAVTQQITNLAKPVQSLREANDKLLLSEKARLAIIQTGINPQLFEQQTLNTRTYETALKQLNVLKSDLDFKRKTREISEATYTTAIAYIDKVIVGLGVENAALQKNTLELEKQKKISETATFLAQGKSQLQGVEAGMRSGFIGQAQSTYADKITQGFTPEQATAMAAQTQALELATTKARALEGAYNDIGSAMASTLTDGVAGLVAGTTTAEQVFVDFLKNIGDALMKAAQQMIAQYLAIAAAKALAGLFGGGSSGGLPSFGYGGGFGSFEGGALGTASGGLGGGDFTSFLPSKSFYKANGGPVSSNSTYMVGEKGPELFVPSTAGTIIPADATAAMARYQRQGGGSGGGNSSSDAMGDGAAATPVLSMSFETTRFLGQDYVSTDQLQAAMMATERRAAAAGAKAGAAQVTSKLQQSPSYRRQVGLR